MLLEDTQELDLHLRRHLANLVQKDRPAVGELKAAEAFLGRARERALLVPEEFALDQASRQGGTVHLDEWPVGALAVRVHGAGDQFLTGPGLAQD